MSKKLLIWGILLIFVLSSITGIIQAPSVQSDFKNETPVFKENTFTVYENDGDSTRGSRSQPKCNFTYLYADGTGAVGSTAYRVYDDNLVIFIEAFPGTNTPWDPASVKIADIILQSPHGHTTHYDADTVAMVAKNTGAYVVGNSQLKSDMQSRSVNASQLVELSPSLGGKQSTTVAGVTITSYGMVHTAMTSTQVDTFMVEMPNGVTFFHGTCASAGSADSYMKGKSEFYYLDALLMDYEHDFAALNTEYAPEILVKTHIIGQTNNVLWTDYPSGQQSLTHNTTHNFQRPNYLPTLSNYAVDPETGTNETTYNFSVTYQYRNDKAPTKYQIVIDGTGYDMAAQAASGWREGVEYKYSTNLDGGSHQYHFEFESDSNSVRLPASGEVDKPDVNSIPLLYGGTVSPLIGDSETEYTFTVTYLDADNDAPSLKKIYIDGTSYDMSSTDSTPNDGAVYTYKTKLAVGDHTYYFSFSDGSISTRFPAVGDLSITDIVRYNTAPVLSAWEVTPGSGDRDTQFTFYITFTDAENDGPVKSKVYIDGEEFQMSTSSATYQNGARYYYRTKLSIGLHQYHFVFNDRFVEVRAPVENDLNYDGPEVENRAPEAKIKTPKDKEEYTTDDDIKFDGAISTDPDDDTLTYEWSSDIDGVLGTDEALMMSLSEGVHNITLKVIDEYNGTSTKTIMLTVIKLRPEYVLSLSIDPILPQEGQTITASANIENIGDEIGYNIDVKILLGDFELESRKINSIYVDNDETITVTFKATPGDHTLKFSILNGTKEETLSFVVSERLKPIANAGEDITVSAGEVVNFDGVLSASSGYIVTYFWDFGDDTNTTGETTTHTYTKAGTFTVTLTVTDELGKEHSDTVTVSVQKKKSDEDSTGLGMYIILPIIIVVVIIILVVFFMLKGKKKKPEAAAGEPPAPSQLPQQDYYQQQYMAPAPMQQYPQMPQQGYDMAQQAGAVAPAAGYDQLPQQGYDAYQGDAVQQEAGMQQLPPAASGYVQADQFQGEQPVEQYPNELTLEQPPATSPGDTISTDLAPATPYDNLQSIDEVEQGQEQPIQESEPIDVPFSSVEEPETETPNNDTTPQPQFGKSLSDLEKEQNGG